MKRLLIQGDPDLRRDDRIAYDDQEVVCFAVTRNADWHGATQSQLWCVVGTEDERDRFETQRYVPHFLETESVAADDVRVVG